MSDTSSPSSDVSPTGLLAANLAGAWAQRANAAVQIMRAASTAPALFKPEAVEQAHADYDRAMAEVARWSA